jgi:uncharacterized protein YbjT (DUF2867 family)
MRVFLAGATGAIGRHLVPQLVEAGHEVTAMTRSEEKLSELHSLGADRSFAMSSTPSDWAWSWRGPSQTR